MPTHTNHQFQHLDELRGQVDTLDLPAIILTDWGTDTSSLTLRFTYNGTPHTWGCPLDTHTEADHWIAGLLPRWTPGIAQKSNTAGTTTVITPQH